MTKLVVANWKMNGDLGLVNGYKNHFSNLKNLIVCPPYPLIPYLVDVVNVGAQNCYEKNKGAFTGEVSPALLKSLGCKYVILGHSERRIYFGETNQDVCSKVECALENDLIPIVCIGTRDENDPYKNLEEQFTGLPSANIILAWEPVWAIGSGRTPSVLQIKQFISWLRQKTQCPTILYGGSVDDNNIDSFIVHTDGFLIGKVSLDLGVMQNILSKIR